MSDIHGVGSASSVSTVTPSKPSSSTLSLPASTATLLPSPSSSPPKSTGSLLPSRSPSSTHIIASTDIPGSLFTRTPSYGSSRSSLHEPDTFSKTLTLPWPGVPGVGRWSIGETTRTDTALVRFVLVIRVTIGSETYELDAPESERELLVAGANDAQRRVALAKYAETQAAKKSKSQSPRRRGRSSRPEDTLPSPPGSPPTQTVPLRQTSSSSSEDAAEPLPRAIHRSHHGYAIAAPPSAPATKTSSRSKKTGPPVAKPSLRRPHTSAGTSTFSAGTTHRTLLDGEVQAWEEELARIEAKSRRSSDLLATIRGRTGSVATSASGRSAESAAT